MVNQWLIYDLFGFMFYFIIKGDLDPTISGEVDLDAGRYSVECADGRQIRVRCENALC